MSGCRRRLSAIALFASLLTVASVSSADATSTPGFVPPRPPPPLDLSPIDFGTFELAAGGIGAADHGLGGSTEVMAGLVAARVEFLGLLASAGSFRAAIRPSLGTGNLSGNLVSLDEMMLGRHYPDMPVCPGFPTYLCDENSGFIGFGFTLLSFDADLDARRNEIRLASVDLVGSFTPAFGKDWKRYRLLPRGGVSLDWLSRSTTDSAAWVFRLMAGLDASFAVGPVLFRPSFRWRPNATAPIADYLLEPKIEIYARTAWSAFHDRDALRVGVELGYMHASVPGNAYGPDKVVGAENTLYGRLVVAPSLFTFGPP